MESIRQWAFGVCAALIVGSMLRIILPKSSLQRVFSLAASVFFLCCLIVPIGKGDMSLPSWKGTAGYDGEQRGLALAQTVQEQARTAAAVDMKKIVEEILGQMGIKGPATTIHIATNGQNDLSVKDIEILLAEEYRPRDKTIKGELRQRLGMEVTLLYENKEVNGPGYAEVDGPVAKDEDSIIPG